jgi:hypothetical protein
MAVGFDASKSCIDLDAPLIYCSLAYRGAFRAFLLTGVKTGLTSCGVSHLNKAVLILESNYRGIVSSTPRICREIVPDIVNYVVWHRHKTH